MGTMSKEEILKILEDAKDKNSDVPMRLVRQAFEKLPEPREDCISRQAAIDAIKGEIEINGYSHVVDVLEQLPSAQPEQRWIPCSERLPEDYTDVLVWFEYFRYGDYNCLYQTYGIGDYSTKYNSWMINHETGWRKLRVIAWMPLPESYKERLEE